LLLLKKGFTYISESNIHNQSHFNDYRKSFRTNEGIEVFNDNVVERIRYLGGKAIETIDELKFHARLKEHLE